MWLLRLYFCQRCLPINAKILSWDQISYLLIILQYNKIPTCYSRFRDWVWWCYLQFWNCLLLRLLHFLAPCSNFTIFSHRFNLAIEQYSRNLYIEPFPCTMDPLIISAEKRLRAKVYKWLLWGLIWRSLTPLITMTLNLLVWELIWTLIFIHFLTLLLSTFEHAQRTFPPKKIMLNTRWGI